MDIQKILQEVDRLFEENKGEEAERLMLESAAQAASEQDDNTLLSILNELIGYYREASRYSEAYRIADRAVAQAQGMGLEGTIPYATTLLNAATAYRAGGRLEEALERYLQVREIYGKLGPNDLLNASFQNNLSLLYQEMGEYEKAKECQLHALRIVKEHGASYETGVTCANLAATCVQMGQMEEAKQFACASMEAFETAGVRDSHYGAALAAMGAWHFRRKEYAQARENYCQAMELVERGVGRNQAYERLKENMEACDRAERENPAVDGEACQAPAEDGSGRKRRQEETADQEARDRQAPEAGVGMALAKAYYETYGVPMIREQFGKYEERIAVGLAGRGSDCFGYDDAASRDHDWGPDFCMWVTDETYDEIGEALQQAYEALPREFCGYRRAPHVNGRNRRGVLKISEFYQGLVGAARYEDIDWRSVADTSLAAAVNGRVFRDDEGVFSEFRNKLLEGYPDNIYYLKLAETAARYAQTAEYNFPRMYRRGEELTARLMVWDGIREAMRLQIFLDGKYPPHDKWLHRSLTETEKGRNAAERLRAAAELLAAPVLDAEALAAKMEELGEYFARQMYAEDFISDIDSYLDAHSEELVYKASLTEKSREELAEEIARLEFQAFDKVQNEGGRASCQNDWFTFSIMRKSQYLTWDKVMLMQYLYDFRRELGRGHNLIEEKYGRMMESTAPERYREIMDHFPELTEEKKRIIEQICGLQVKWMEEFSAEYPALADNARAIHTSEDDPFDTSYETYLRGELGTYSDKMLELYGRYIVRYAGENRNPARDIMENSVKMYGYESIDEAERKVGKAMGG